MPAVRPRIGGPANKAPRLDRPSAYVSRNASNNLTRAMPDLAEGSCRSMLGQKNADLGMNTSVSSFGIADRARAKDQCWSCPVVKVCQRYVLAGEKPAGSWGGVWGGLDLWNRQGLEVIQGTMRDDEKAGAKVVPFSIEAAVKWTEENL